MVVVTAPPTYSNVVIVGKMFVGNDLVVTTANTISAGISFWHGGDEPIDYEYGLAVLAAAPPLDEPPASPLPRSPFDL
jgi:hypothetical protein